MQQRLRWRHLLHLCVCVCVCVCVRVCCFFCGLWSTECFHSWIHCHIFSDNVTKNYWQRWIFNNNFYVMIWLDEFHQTIQHCNFDECEVLLKISGQLCEWCTTEWCFTHHPGWCFIPSCLLFIIFHTILVACNGFPSDFISLVAKVKCHKLDEVFNNITQYLLIHSTMLRGWVAILCVWYHILGIVCGRKIREFCKYGSIRKCLFALFYLSRRFYIMILP